VGGALGISMINLAVAFGLSVRVSRIELDLEQLRHQILTRRRQ
jgi:hypothetical protein